MLYCNLGTQPFCHSQNLQVPVTTSIKTDSAITTLQQLPNKYIQKVNSKIDRYSNRLTAKTEKTLIKLSRWENKIQALLQKANPAAAERLFGKGQPTFNSMLKKVQEGGKLVQDNRAHYNEYRDQLSTGIKYLASQKDRLDSNMVTKAVRTTGKLDQLEAEVADAEAVTQFIKTRKKQLVDISLQYIGKNKYLSRINKESYYYAETLKNYKAIFSDPSKAEKAAREILDKVPAFKQFMQKNSMLASLFGRPSGYGSAQSVEGLQTRASVNALILSQLAAGGPNARNAFTQSMQQAQTELGKLKDNVLKAGGGNSSDLNMPGFKPNNQKTKIFLQRVVFGTNFQFAKNTGNKPGFADIGLSAGYKIDDRSIAGLGISYKMGIGRIDRISISHQGVGLRSFVDWKLKKQFFISGGYELNYNTAFSKLNQLQNKTNWQRSGLIGLSKKVNIKSKLAKATRISLLYDMLYKTHLPQSQPVLYRIGYDF